jgi:hypothetical protein
MLLTFLKTVFLGASIEDLAKEKENPQNFFLTDYIS